MTVDEMGRKKKKLRGSRGNSPFFKRQNPLHHVTHTISHPECLAGCPSGSKLLCETGSSTEGIDF